ncbi:MAG: hypothetical protein WCS96_06595 [Victivallales bacterium]
MIYEQVYYPESIKTLSEWQNGNSGQSRYTVIESAEKRPVILSWNISADIELNGVSIRPAQVTYTRDSYSQKVFLRTGSNKLTVSSASINDLNISLCGTDGLPLNTVSAPVPCLTETEKVIPFASRAATHAKAEHQRNSSIKDFCLGIGGGSSPSCGRFGFTDESGLLDYSQLAMGVIARLHRMGHPDNRQLTMWRLSCRPPHTSGTMFKLPPGKVDFNSESERHINWISYTNRTTLRSTGNFHNRKRGDYVNFATTVSLATPGFLVETDDSSLVLSDYAPAGEFLYLGLPLRSGFTIRNTAAGSSHYDLSADGPLTDNWILLWGNSQAGLMETPLLVVLQRQPKKIHFDRKEETIEISGEREFGYAILASPYGIELFHSEETVSLKWLGKTLELCSFWSKAMLAYPVNMEEFYRIDEQRERVHIIQRFQYRHLEDDWNSSPLEIAPLPPPVALAASRVAEIDMHDAENLKFPTQYGELYGVIGRNSSEYEIPLPTLTRKFHFKTSGENRIGELFRADFDEYMKYHDSQPGTTPSPGAYGSLVHFALPLTLFNFIDSGACSELSERLKLVLSQVTDPKASYEFNKNIGGIGIFDNGKNIEGHCNYWYERTEPHTRMKYIITYLHVSNILKFGKLTRKNIEASEFPMIENDWGNGFSLYYIYLTAMLTGDWIPVRKNWSTIKKAFRYFEIMQDWACMSTACYEDGATWNDGTNFGAYLGFTQMARLLGEDACYDRGLYAAAKNTVLRLAQFLAGSEYFPRYMGGVPWWTHKFFHEGLTGTTTRFLCHPKLEGSIRRETIFNLSTEGIYPEIIDILHRYLPEHLEQCCRKIYESEPDCLKKIAPSLLTWNGSDRLGRQELYSLLLMEIAGGTQSESELKEKITGAHANGRLFHEWITADPKYRRRIPRNWSQCDLLTRLAGRNCPVWMETWIGIKIKSAELDPDENKAVIYIEGGPGTLNFGFTSMPEAFYFEHHPIGFRVNSKSIRLEIPSSGTLEIKLKKRDILTKYQEYMIQVAEN